jgi:hypothetical protein
MPLTDSNLNSEALIIKNETVLRANTAVRIGTMLQHLIDNKINNDKISTNTSLGTSNTLIPSQAAVKSYVDGRTLNDILTAGNTSLLDAGVGALNIFSGSLGNLGKVTFNSDIFTFLDSNPNDIFSVKDGELNILSSAGTIDAKISSSALSASRTFDLPNKSGTIALTNDIPKRFIALISQSGTANPTLTIIRNDFSGTISATRNAAGDYTLTNTLPEFTNNKTTACINNSTNYAVKFTGATRTGNTTISLAVFNLSGVAVDTYLLGDVLQIEVYS